MRCVRLAAGAASALALMLAPASAHALSVSGTVDEAEGSVGAVVESTTSTVDSVAADVGTVVDSTQRQAANVVETGTTTVGNTVEKAISDVTKAVDESVGTVVRQPRDAVSPVIEPRAGSRDNGGAARDAAGSAGSAPRPGETRIYADASSHYDGRVPPGAPDGAALDPLADAVFAAITPGQDSLGLAQDQIGSIGTSSGAVSVSDSGGAAPTSSIASGFAGGAAAAYALAPQAFLAIAALLLLLGVATYAPPSPPLLLPAERPG